MNPITPEIVDEILAEYRKTPSPFKIAKKLGFDVKVVWAVIDDHPDRLAAHVEQWEGQGRPELLDYRIGRIKAYAHWDNEEPEIAAARKAYEEGTVEIVTGRDGAWLLLYAIPRKYKQPRPNYFTLEL